MIIILPLYKDLRQKPKRLSRFIKDRMLQALRTPKESSEKFRSHLPLNFPPESISISGEIEITTHRKLFQHGPKAKRKVSHKPSYINILAPRRLANIEISKEFVLNTQGGASLQPAPPSVTRVARTPHIATDKGLYTSLSH